MDFPAFIHEYGYAAVLVGGVFEGETITLLAGFAARQGLLSLPWVMVCAMSGVLISGQFTFYCGRFFGTRLLARWPRLAARVDKFHVKLERYETRILLTYQFLPGTATVVPFTLGMGKIKSWRFTWLDVIGTASWAASQSLLGWFFGAAAQPLIERYKTWAFIGIAILVLVIVSIAKRRLGRVIVEE